MPLASGGSRKFWWGGILKHETSKIRMSSPKLRVIFRPKSEIQPFFSPEIRWSPKTKKKKKKGLHQNSELFFGRNRKVEAGGGDASRNGTELIKIKADFSAKIVTFRLVRGCIPTIPPPKSATAAGAGTRTRAEVNFNRISNFSFFFWTKRVTTVKFEVMNPNRT